MRYWAGLALLACGLPAVGGPMEFGLEQLYAAMAARGISHRIDAQIDNLPPESFEITRTGVRGGDLRGLMYGLLAAAEQVRATGAMQPETFVPITSLRGVRIVPGQRTPREWDTLMRQMVHGRYNRLNLIGPPMALEDLHELSVIALRYAVDIMLSTDERRVEELKKLFAAGSAIRGVQVDCDAEGALPVFVAILGSGRRIAFDLRNWTQKLDVIERAVALGVTLQLSAQVPDCAPPDMAYTGTAGFETSLACYDLK